MVCVCIYIFEQSTVPVLIGVQSLLSLPPFPLLYFDEEPHGAAVNCPSSICTNPRGPWGLLWLAVPIHFVYFACWLHLGLM